MQELNIHNCDNNKLSALNVHPVTLRLPYVTKTWWNIQFLHKGISNYANCYCSFRIDHLDILSYQERKSKHKDTGILRYKNHS